MNTVVRSRYFLFALALTLIVAFPLSAQEKGKGLIFSEVYLDAKVSANNWIEVYNPTGKSLILERLHLSGVLALDVLPVSIKREGGIEISPGEYLILCADDERFNSIWGDQLKPISVTALPHLSEGGGIVALATKGLEEAGNDGFRYGNPGISSYIEYYLGSQVLKYTDNGASHSREILETESGTGIGNFHETVPTPGRPNYKE